LKEGKLDLVSVCSFIKFFSLGMYFGFLLLLHKSKGELRSLSKVYGDRKGRKSVLIHFWMGGNCN